MDRHARHRRTAADRRRRPVDGYRTRDARRFARLVEEAMRALPPTLAAELRRIAVVVEDVPPAAALHEHGPPPLAANRTSPSDATGATAASTRRDVITLFRRPLEARAVDRGDLVDLITEHLVAQLAELLGWDEDDLGRAGWE